MVKRAFFLVGIVYDRRRIQKNEADQSSDCGQHPRRVRVSRPRFHLPRALGDERCAVELGGSQVFRRDFQRRCHRNVDRALQVRERSDSGASRAFLT